MIAELPDVSKIQPPAGAQPTKRSMIEIQAKIEKLVKEVEDGVEGAWHRLCEFFGHKPEATSTEIVVAAANHDAVTGGLHERIVHVATLRDAAVSANPAAVEESAPVPTEELKAPAPVEPVTPSAVPASNAPVNVVATPEIPAA